MKKMLMIILPVALLIIGGMAYLTQAEEDPSGLSREDRSFLMEMADARMMDWAQGNLATERGTLDKYRHYGKRIMRDQDKLMNDLRQLAGKKNLVLPDSISAEKNEALHKLKQTSGRTFERRFRRMIIKDHKRDIELLERAAQSTDADVQAFAVRYLPLVQAHLEQARALNEE